MSQSDTYYPTFRDGKRIISYILVYKVSSLVTEKAATRYQAFINTLQALGLQLEYETFSVDDDIRFIKIHITDELTMSYAALFNIDLAFRSFDYRPFVRPPCSFLATPLTKPNVNDPIFARAPESISGEIPKKITSGERIMVVNEILNRCIWGEERGDYGVHRVIKANVFIDAFPLHDGDFKWTTSGPLNDRQLLNLFWSSAKNWTKAQPLNLVEKYFGTEYALYFAWLGMYIKHLIPAAILSIMVVIYGVITMSTPLNSHACHFLECPMEALSNSCYMANITYIFDNWCAVVFAGVMSLWATIFMEFWQRHESVLQLQWNVRALEYTISFRPEYLNSATKRKFSPVTGKMEPYVSKKLRACRYTLTFVTLALLLLIVVLATFGVMVYRVSVNVVLLKSDTSEILRNKYRGIVASVSGALMSGIFIFLFKWLYETITLNLTNMENHRSHREYSNAYIYKSYALAFANNYSAVFYIAFFKGKFFTYPGDLHQLSYLGGINTDVCDPSGCVVDLAILLIIIMTLKAIFSNVTQVLVPKIQRYLNRTIHKVKNEEEIPQWESEFLLAKTKEFFIVGEYMDMVIQYGFVNFFIMGFPLAPLFALLNNIGELRVDASKVTKSYRRPVPVRINGIGAWFGILQAATYVGVVTNALVIAFTSNFMEKAIYEILKDECDIGFLNQTLSGGGTYVYDLSDFEVYHKVYKQVNLTGTCYYQGKRYAPDHALKYTRRKDYWQHLGIKFATVVIFEHIVAIFKGLLAYAIPDVPFSVKQQIMHQEHMDRKAKMMDMNKKYLKQRWQHHIIVIIKGLLAYAIPDVPFSVKQQIMHQEHMGRKAKMMDTNKHYLKQRGATRGKMA